MRISDSISVVCSADLRLRGAAFASLSHVIVSVGFVVDLQPASGTKMNIACSSEKNRRLFWQAAVLNLAKRPSRGREALLDLDGADRQLAAARLGLGVELPLLALRSEDHTSELQSLMRISYALLWLTNK